MATLTPRGTAYESFGSGPRVIALVHGLGLNRHSWQWQVPALSSTHRVITFDLHGHGDSSVPPTTPSKRSGRRACSSRRSATSTS